MKFAFVTLYIRDMEKSLACYRDTLGLPLQGRMPTEDGELAFLGPKDGASIELVAAPHFAESAHTGFSVGLEVDDLPEATRTMEAAGYPLLRGPISPHPGTAFSFFRGPDGEEIELICHG